MKNEILMITILAIVDIMPEHINNSVQYLKSFDHNTFH